MWLLRLSHLRQKKVQRSEAAPLISLLTSHLCSWTRPPQHSLHLEQGGTNCQMGPTCPLFSLVLQTSEGAGGYLSLGGCFLPAETRICCIYFFSPSGIQNLKGVAARKKQGGSLCSSFFDEGVPHAMFTRLGPEWGPSCCNCRRRD